MVGKDVARIDWSTDPTNTGTIMPMAMKRRSPWVSGSRCSGGEAMSSPGARTSPPASGDVAVYPLRSSFIENHLRCGLRYPAPRHDYYRRHYRQTGPVSLSHRERRPARAHGRPAAEQMVGEARP